jgi:GTP-binding protein
MRKFSAAALNRSFVRHSGFDLRLPAPFGALPYHSAMPRLPAIVIVGRPNVGKSSILNLLAGRKVSIVDPTAGVTRDRVSTLAVIPPQTKHGKFRRIELIDTGGYGIEDTANLTTQVEAQIARGIAQADLIFFVIDAQSGIVPLDQKTATLLRQSNARAPVVLIANKVDSSRHEADAVDAMRLGFGEPITLSAITAYHKHDLYEAIHDRIDWSAFPASDASALGRGAKPDDDADDEDEERDPSDAEFAPEDEDTSGGGDSGGAGEMKLAIVGKRNAGKSTLVNALAGEERVIVSEVEGTTRDAIDVRFEIDGKPFLAIDTAGVRKGKSLSGDIEYYSHHRALRSVRRADVVLLVIDAAVPVSQVDKQLGNEILKHHRPCVLVVNKWDLAEQNYTQEQYLEYLDKALKGFDFAPVVFLCAQKGEGVRDAVAMAMNLHEQARHRVGTAELNKVMETILAERGPSAKGGKRPKIYYVTQLAVDPPTIALFVNNVLAFDHNYQRFLINRFRDLLPYSEVPIKLLIRARRSTPKSERLASGHPERTGSQDLQDQQDES